MEICTEGLGSWARWRNTQIKVNPTQVHEQMGYPVYLAKLLQRHELQCPTLDSSSHEVREGKGHRVQEGVQRVLHHQMQEDVLHDVQDAVQHRLQEGLLGLVRQEDEMVGHDSMRFLSFNFRVAVLMVFWDCL